MNKTMVLIPLALLVLAGSACNSRPGERSPAPAAAPAPDNTGRNVQDRSGATLTPGDQSESEADRTLSQKVRQAVMADKSLSTTAHNIKIISINGLVTLRGPVHSAQEKAAIDATARQIAGATKVDNQLEIVAN